MTLREAAIEVLRTGGPKHYEKLTEEILARGLATSESKRPAGSLYAVIAIDMKRHGAKSEFVRLRKGVFGLRADSSTAPEASLAEQGLEGAGSGADSQEKEWRVRVPYFPSYAEVRRLLDVWKGRPRKQVTGLQTTLAGLRGTPQSTVDWTKPDEWIPARLDGADRELASAIWEKSRKTINPRHTHGAWLLSQRYGLLREGADGVLEWTDQGRDFAKRTGGETEAYLDEQEGLVKLLTLVVEQGPARPGELLGEWISYLSQHSSFGSDSTFRDTLRRRLNNLLDRELIRRSGALYAITDAGLTYLSRVTPEAGLDEEVQQEIWALTKRQDAAIRERLRDVLLEMDPYAFEHLVKRLLLEMDYQNVAVTTRSGDGGVDVIGEIQLGITSVREVVQVKRHRKTIQRKDLDALRGSLYRFNAVRGTIISTASFSKGTAEAAFAPGVAPITLIDGERLIDMMIEHKVGVKKQTVDILTVELDVFAEGVSDEDSV